MNTVDEKVIDYLNGHEPAERDAIYQRLRGQGQPNETLESLTEKLVHLNPRQHREEIHQIRASIDEKMELEREKQLTLFINEQLDKPGSVNTRAIQEKAAELDIHGDMAPHINRVVELRSVFKGKER